MNESHYRLGTANEQPKPSREFSNHGQNNQQDKLQIVSDEDAYPIGRQKCSAESATDNIISTTSMSIDRSDIKQKENE